MWRMCKICQRDGVQRTTDGAVDLLPGVTDRTAFLKFTLAVSHAALGDAQRSLKHVDDLRRTDALRRARQGIAAIRSAQ